MVQVEGVGEVVGAMTVHCTKLVVPVFMVM